MGVVVIRGTQDLQLASMAEHGKCPMGKHPWLATFFALAFVLVFFAHKLGLL
jgi:hypothetical protein